MRTHVAQRVALVKTNYDEGNFPRVLGYATEAEMGQHNPRYDPPGNYTIQDVRAMLIKTAGTADYDYRDVFDPSRAAAVSVEKQRQLEQLALLEMRGLVHQYFAAHRPPYADARQNLFLRRAAFLLSRLQQRNLPLPWERVEVLACYGDLAVLDGQYEAADTAYGQILGNPKSVPDEVLAQYGKRYLQSHANALSHATVSMDREQARIFETRFADNLQKLADAVPDLPVGMYAKVRLQASAKQPLPAFATALLMWRRTESDELRTMLDQFVTLELQDYWPLIQSDAAFRKLILDQWNDNKRATQERSLADERGK